MPPPQPRWGISNLRFLSQGSREARQPWALFGNRFAVVPITSRISIPQSQPAPLQELSAAHLHDPR